jgi:hypothetical protein
MHHQVSEPTRTWGLPFPFLITHMLRKKGIKGNAANGPIIEHPRFSRIQWNQSCSHMPRVATKSKPMDIHEMATEQEIAAEPEMAEGQEEEADEQPDEEEYEEMITLRAADVYALQDTLEDMRFQIADIQRDAHQDRLELRAMMQDILARLPPAQGAFPPAPRASSAPPQ